MQRSASTVDPAGVRPSQHNLGLDLPPYTPCAPECPTCTLARLDEVEVAVIEQAPELGDPRRIAVLVVLGMPTSA